MNQGEVVQPRQMDPYWFGVPVGSDKPTVRYKAVDNLAVGRHAYVLPVDHPSPYVSNQTWAKTSEVLAIRPGGPNALGPTFETLNTIYVALEFHPGLIPENEFSGEPMKVAA